MDHNDATRLQAAVKYVLGELPQDLRDEYEEHYFDCAECALDVRAAAVFSDNARNVLCQAEREAEQKTAVPAGGRWLAWLKPAVAAPVFAVLLLGLGYESFVSVPHWKNEAMQAAAPRLVPMHSLIRANSRGGASQALQVRKGDRLDFYIDVPADPTYTKYTLRLEEPDGKATILGTVSYTEAQKTLFVEITPGKTGAYKIVVLGLTEQLSDPARAPVLATMKFDVELGT